MKILRTTLLAGLLCLPLLASAQGTWDKTKWPNAERYSPDQGRDFKWKPGPSNQPMGEARGIFPGRVVMARYPEAARWPGRWNKDEDQWFLDKYTDADKCEEMLSATLQKLTGTKNNKKAWDKIFRHHNQEIRNLKKRGYQTGESVAIKINLNNSSSDKRNNQSDATPQMTLAVVRHLVRDAGVPEDKIMIFDVKRQIYGQLLLAIWREFPDVRFIQDGEARKEQPVNPRYGNHHGIEGAKWVEGIEFSKDNDRFRDAKLMAEQIKDATYLINLAMLKLHSYPYNYMEHGDNGQTAITMSSKNHAGSIRGTGEMHRYFNSTEIRKRGLEHEFNPLIDLEASPNLGRKTILFLLDGLYCGRKWSTYPVHFPNAPFYNKVEPYENPEWPACLLASFDPVAIQSVGLDIFYAQSQNNEETGYYNVPRILVRDMADDILKAMATPWATPSGTVYKQNGKPIPSLGVFEHWDGPETMRYSRNIDPKKGRGIEFIYIPMGSARPLGDNASRSLVPDTPSSAPDYFCTWNIQGYITSYQGSEGMRRAMTEQGLFGHDAYERWVSFFPQIRRDLYFVLDDSWDIPAEVNYKNDNPYVGTLELDPTRFPSFKGNAVERMRRLADSIEGNGWKGLGLWVSAQKAPQLKDQDETAFWQGRLRDAEAARVRYWKVDWGKRDRDDQYRRDIAQWARQYAPNLTLENAMKGQYITFSDAFRTYDVENIISQPVTIDRVAQLLPFKAQGEARGIINCEDEPYIAAGLGCAIGIMRHPYAGALPNGRKDHVFPESVRDLKHRLDEAIRGVRWHRIAQPFAVDGNFQQDEVRLHDYWTYAAEESWMNRPVGEHVPGEASARISRCMPLPVTTDNSEQRPYLLASRYPNGATALAAIGRTIDREYISRPVPVEIEIADWKAPVGLFGVLGDVTLRIASLPGNVRVLAQDLKADVAEDITSEVRIGRDSIVLSAALLHRIGLAAATPGDKSDPGLVLQLFQK